MARAPKEHRSLALRGTKSPIEINNNKRTSHTHRHTHNNDSLSSSSSSKRSTSRRSCRNGTTTLSCADKANKCGARGKGPGQVQCEINRTNEATGKPRQGHTHTQADNKRDNEDSASGADESSTGSKGSSCFGELLWL